MTMEKFDEGGGVFDAETLDMVHEVRELKTARIASGSNEEGKKIAISHWRILEE